MSDCKNNKVNNNSSNSNNCSERCGMGTEERLLLQEVHDATQIEVVHAERTFLRIALIGTLC